MTRTELLEFLRGHPFAVQASVSAPRSLQAAAAGLADTIVPDALGLPAL